MFKVEKKVTDAHFPRIKGATTSIDDKLKIVYNKFTNVSPLAADKIRINLVFNHGTGMNRFIWNYYIEQLYAYAQNQPDWYLGSVISYDDVSHGDSAMINREKLGWAYSWFDGGKDLVKIVKHENDTCNDFLNNRLSRNILIGHSLGGHQVTMAGFIEPELFDTLIIVEPVLFGQKKLFPTFLRRSLKIAEVTIDEFPTFERYKKYEEKYSFLKDLHPRILKDFVDNEFYEVYDPATQTTKYRTKADKIGQMATYLSSYEALPKSMAVLSHIDCKICFVYGEKAAWNPPGTIEFITSSIKPENLLETHSVKNGSHLINVEQPDDILKIIKGVLTKRTQTANALKDQYPEIVYNGDRKKIIELQYKLMQQGKVRDTIFFEDVLRKQSKL